MSAVFADTSFYLAAVNPNDTLHARAARAGRRLRRRVVTTHYVLTELGSALSRVKHRPVFLALARRMRDDPATLIIPASDELFEQGLDLFEQRADKDWSLVDCISFSVMKRLRIVEALTEDHHFEQAGYKALLR